MVALKSIPAEQLPARSLPDRVMALLEKVDYRRADTVEEREAIFRLRYEAYLREGVLAPSPSQRLCDQFDDAANAWIFGLYIDDQLVSSIRLHVAHRKCPVLPALDVYSDLLSPEIAVGRTIVDPTRFVSDRTASRRYPELCYATTRLAVLAKPQQPDLPDGPRLSARPRTADAEPALLPLHALRAAHAVCPRPGAGPALGGLTAGARGKTVASAARVPQSVHEARFPAGRNAQCPRTARGSWS
jgi:hypothetical protein